MGRLTEMSLLFVLLMTSSAFGAVVTPTSEADSSDLVPEQLNEPLNNEAAEQPQESWGPSCPFGWTLINRRCFLYIRQSKDWASAESHCLSLGANLVSIHSEYEYQRVKALIRSHDSRENPTWLGLSNCEKRNSWFWSDGTRFVYSKWNRYEPNNLNGECCVHMNWGSEKNWNDIPCHLSYPFVCVRRV